MEWNGMAWQGMAWHGIAVNPHGSEFNHSA